MTKHFHHSNLIENIDDEKFDEQMLWAWGYILSKDKLTHGVIKKIQKLLTLPQDDLAPHQRGYYRDTSKVNVMVGHYYAPMWHMVNSMMNDWLLDYKDRDPLINHIAFEKIHPFVDGNGRTGRMLMWWQEVKDGKEPTFFDFNKRDKYYELFK